MTGVPHRSPKHKLKSDKDNIPVRQKKRGKLRRAKAISGGVHKLRGGRYQRESLLYDWLSNPVKSKKAIVSWRLCVTSPTLNKDCPQVSPNPNAKDDEEKDSLSHKSEVSIAIQKRCLFGLKECGCHLPALVPIQVTDKSQLPLVQNTQDVEEGRLRWSTESKEAFTLLKHI
ncbi:hypothetical protein Tco_0679173 [Tanacetum coccineum]|uniref:Uncharacterized protein n=1 Tax=Tanacetum coccineum TaxID=301880 RepID=A0ABQ4XH44_9ASTR